MKNFIVRGIIIGGSVGLLYGLVTSAHLGRAIALGMVGGFLAGLTLARRKNRQD